LLVIHRLLLRFCRREIEAEIAWQCARYSAMAEFRERCAFLRGYEQGMAGLYAALELLVHERGLPEWTEAELAEARKRMTH
jgi:hypothetical protein